MEEVADGSCMDEIMIEIIRLADISVKSLLFVIPFVCVDIPIVPICWIGMAMEVVLRR